MAVKLTASFSCFVCQATPCALTANKSETSTNRSCPNQFFKNTHCAPMPPSQTQSCDTTTEKPCPMLQQISHNMTVGAEIKPDRQVCQITSECEWNQAENSTPIRARFHLKFAGNWVFPFFRLFLSFLWRFSGPASVMSYERMWNSHSVALNDSSLTRVCTWTSSLQCTQYKLNLTLKYSLHVNTIKQLLTCYSNIILFFPLSSETLFLLIKSLIFR